MHSIPVRDVNVKTVTIRRDLLIALLVIVLVGSLGAYWAQLRIETHIGWATELRTVAQFRIHMLQASALVNAAANNQTQRIWLSDELDYAAWTINSLSYIDQDHSTKLGTMYDALQNLRGAHLDPYLASLNSTQLDTLATILHSISDKFLGASTNFLNYTTYSETVTGPSFWYNGPAPPDEGLL